MGLSRWVFVPKFIPSFLTLPSHHVCQNMATFRPSAESSTRSSRKQVFALRQGTLPNICCHESRYSITCYHVCIPISAWSLSSTCQWFQTIWSFKQTHTTCNSIGLSDVKTAINLPSRDLRGNGSLSSKAFARYQWG